MKIKKILTPEFEYPKDVKVYVPYSSKGLSEYIEWPQDIIELFDSPLGGGRNIFFYHFFEKMIKSNIKKINYLEIGVFLGGSVIEIFKLASYFGIKLEITVVDTFQGTKNEIMDGFIEHYDDTNSFKNKFVKNLKDNNVTNVTIFEGCSDDFFSNNSEKFDLIYLDADHSYEAVIKDINNSLKNLKTGGYVTGDDYHPCWGVFNAVNSFSKKYNIKIVGEMWYFDI
jgi:hypothetical protein